MIFSASIAKSFAKHPEKLFLICQVSFKSTVAYFLKFNSIFFITDFFFHCLIKNRWLILTKDDRKQVIVFNLSQFDPELVTLQIALTTKSYFGEPFWHPDNQGFTAFNLAHPTAVSYRFFSLEELVKEIEQTGSVQSVKSNTSFTFKGKNM